MFNATDARRIASMYFESQEEARRRASVHIVESQIFPVIKEKANLGYTIVSIPINDDIERNINTIRSILWERDFDVKCRDGNLLIRY